MEEVRIALVIQSRQCYEGIGGRALLLPLSRPGKRLESSSSRQMGPRFVAAVVQPGRGAVWSRGMGGFLFFWGGGKEEFKILVVLVPFFYHPRLLNPFFLTAPGRISLSPVCFSYKIKKKQKRSLIIPNFFCGVTLTIPRLLTANATHLNKGARLLAFTSC